MSYLSRFAGRSSLSGPREDVSGGPHGSIGPPPIRRGLVGLPDRRVPSPSRPAGGAPRSRDLVTEAPPRPGSWTPLQLSISASAAGAAPGSRAPAGTPRHT